MNKMIFRILIIFIFVTIITFIGWVTLDLAFRNQKSNNYIKCLNITTMAQKTRKIPQNISPIKLCRYHLE